MPGASSGWATVTAPVASLTSASAPQWSQCWWVVTIFSTGVLPIMSSSVAGSAAASMSSAWPVALSRSRYALLSIEPTATLLSVIPSISRESAGPPTVTSPVYVTVRI